MKLIVMALRIALLVVIGLAVLALAGAAAIRQPIWGTTLHPPGAPSADPNLLRRHVEYLTVDAAPRNDRHPEHLSTAAAYIASHLGTSGANVSEQRYFAAAPGGRETEHRNLIARFGSDEGPVVVVGAHYDVFGDLPGADDNASGVAGLLEVARLLFAHRPKSPVELVAYSTEEPPYFGSGQMGSAVHALDLAERGVTVRAMVCLEMIGYFVERQPQEVPLLDLLYPRHGRFAAVVGRWEDRKLARAVKRGFRGASDLPVYSYSGPVAVGADLSDHRNYWQQDVPAVMVTDTAFLRNPNYHTAGDTPDSLDYDRMAAVVDGVLGAVLQLAASP